MESDEKMFKTICRLCLSTEDSDKFVSLVENNSASGMSCYGESVKRFAQISIEKDDKLPKNMCQKCLYLLKCAIYFKFKCEASEKVLKQWTNVKVNKKRKQESTATENNQDSLFKQYFSNLNHSTTSSSIKDSQTSKKSAKLLLNNDENDYSDDSLPDDRFSAEDHQASINVNLEDSSDILDLLENNPLTMQTIRNKDKQNIKPNIKSKRIPRKKGDKFVCEICKKVLANQQTFDQHMQYHYGCKYICEHCGKGFPVLSRLQMHLVTLHGTGPYLPCQYCSYKAPRHLSLIEHERLHTGERPYTCEKCGLTFRRRAIWKKHLIHHAEKTIQCRQCPRKFYTVGDMRAHANNIHERVYMYSCHKCDATYAKTESVRKHLVERHGIPREIQGKIVRINRGKPSNIVEP